MKTLNKKIVAAKVALMLALTSIPGVVTPVYAGIPVIDAANLMQTIVTAMENVAQTIKQIEQYRTQLQQYSNMLQNTAAPSSYIWDRASVTITNLRTEMDTLSRYRVSLGSIDAYLAKTKDLAGYRSSPCYTSAGCSPTEWAAMRDSTQFGSEAQKKASDAVFRSLALQQDALQSDATQLERLQSSAQGATGQMEAIGYANQLASHQANQLLQIRGLLMSQQNLVATRDKYVADKEAKEAAAAIQLRNGTYRPSPSITW